MRLMQESPVLLKSRLLYEVFDDFDWYITPHFWTSLAADGGVTAPAQSDAESGVIQGATGATDNNEIMVRSTNEVALFQNNYTFLFESYIQYTESNTDDANIAVGLANAAAANLLADDGAGVTGLSDSGCLIYKVDGGTVWRCYSRSGAGTAVDTVSAQTAGGASYQRLTIKGRTTLGSNEMEITFFLDGKEMTDANNAIIHHTLSLGTPTEMRVVAFYAKAGSANSETINCDSCYFGATRLQA